MFDIEIRHGINVLIMFDFFRKKQLPFGVISANDDSDIEVHQIKAASRQGIWLELFKLLRDIVLVFAVFVIFLVFVIQPVVVDGSSMLPNLHQSERLVVNKLIYYKLQNVSWGHIERGDIVVFWFPKEPDKSYVKRVIGLPGETVEIRNGIVFIDGEAMHEDYIDASFNQNAANFPAHKVDEHYYYVMGDNRDNSSDSRYWGLVPEKYIYGKVFFRYWMPANFGFIRRGNFELAEPSAENDIRAEKETSEENR